MTVKVLIADDQALLRGSFRVLIESEDDLSVVGEAGDGEEAVRLTRETGADLVLMDVRMPKMNGIEATREVAGLAKVLMLTTFNLDEYVFSALRAGASGFLLKDAPPDDLLHAIRVVASGEALLAPTVTRQVVAEFVRRPGRAVPRGLDTLTDREREVLTLIALGLSNAEIRTELHVSPATVKTHISHLLTKLQVRDRAQLVIAAYESGLIAPTP